MYFFACWLFVSFRGMCTRCMLSSYRLKAMEQTEKVTCYTIQRNYPKISADTLRTHFELNE